MARYIDKEKTLKIIYDFKENCEYINYGTLLDIIREIHELPTEDVQPIVRGKWNDWYFENGYTDAFHCQVCQHLFAVTQGKENMKFCPNCGAKMEKVEK